MRPYTFKIPAGDFVTEMMPGNYLRLDSATVPITFESEDSQQRLTLQQGDDAQLVDFTRMRIYHSDAAEQTITVYVGRGVKISSARVGGTMVVVPTQSSTGSQAAGTVGTTSASIKAANSARKFLHIQHVGETGIVTLNIFGGAAVRGQGVTLWPGDSVQFDGLWCPTAQINAIGTEAAIPVAVTEGQ